MAAAAGGCRPHCFQAVLRGLPRVFFGAYWVAELEAVQLRIVEIEGRIEELRRLAQQLYPQGPDDNLQARLIDVLNDTLDRTTTQVMLISARRYRALRSSGCAGQHRSKLRLFTGPVRKGLIPLFCQPTGHANSAAGPGVHGGRVADGTGSPSQVSSPTADRATMRTLAGRSAHWGYAEDASWTRQRGLSLDPERTRGRGVVKIPAICVSATRCFC